MKKLTATLLVTVTLMLTALGCATTGVGSPSKKEVIQSVAPAVKAAAFGGSFYALKERPDWLPGFQTAAKELRVIENTEVIDFTLVLAIVARLPIAELQSEDARLAITMGTIVLSGYAANGKVVDLSKLNDYKPIVKALREGVELALGARPIINYEQTYRGLNIVEVR